VFQCSSIPVNSYKPTCGFLAGNCRHPEPRESLCQMKNTLRQGNLDGQRFSFGCGVTALFQYSSKSFFPISLSQSRLSRRGLPKSFLPPRGVHPHRVALQYRRLSRGRIDEQAHLIPALWPQPTSSESRASLDHSKELTHFRSRSGTVSPCSGRQADGTETRYLLSSLCSQMPSRL